MWHISWEIILKKKSYKWERRAICHGSYWTDKDVVTKEKYFSIIPAAPRTRFRGIICHYETRACIPETSRRYSSFRESYHTRKFYLPCLSRHLLSSNPLIASVIMWLFFVRFGSGEPLNRARWHNGRSRQSPTCYHCRRQRIVKPQIVNQLRVTLRFGRVIFTCENRTVHVAIGKMNRWFRLNHLNTFEFLCKTVFSNEQNKNLILL